MRSIVFLLCLVSLELFSQPMVINGVKDSTTNFGYLVPKNSLALDLANKDLWLVGQKAISTTSLEDITQKYLLNRSALIDTTKIIYSTGGNNVMGQPLKMSDDTLYFNETNANPYIVSSGDTLYFKGSSKYFFDNGINSGSNNISSSNNYSFGENNNTTGGYLSFCFGNNNIAKNYMSAFSIGSYNKSDGYNAFSIGYYNLTKGNNSYSIGYNNYISGVTKIALGFGIRIPDSQERQVYIGQYNDTTYTDLFQIGVGKDNDNRANAFRIGQDSGVHMPLLPPATTNMIAYVDTANDNKLSYGAAPTPDTTNIIYSTGGNNVMGQDLEIDKKLIVLKGEFGGTSSISEALFSYGDAGNYINFSNSSGRILRSENGALTVKSTDVNKDVTLGVGTGINNYENYLQHTYDTISIRKNTDIGLNIINKSDTTAFSVKSNGNLKISSPLFLDSIPAATTPNTLYYNTTTKEVSYGTSANGFFFVQDSSVTITPAVQDTFYHVTNATNNLFTQGDTLYTNIQNDTIFFTVAGKYKIEFDVTLQGASSKDYSFIIKNNIPCNGVKTVTGNGVNNYISVSGKTVCSMTAGEFIVLQFANRSGTEDIIIRDASIYVEKID